MATPAIGEDRSGEGTSAALLHGAHGAVRDQSGTIRGFAKVTRDMTERRQALELLQTR